jgi:CRISPR-associated endoribonuclease Cas6
MLLSVLVELRAASQCLILGPLGIPNRSWFLEQVRHFDPSLSAELHGGSGPKPYTVSTLLDADGIPLGPGRVLSPGESCWIRITSYSGRLSNLIWERLIKDIQSRPKPISIFQMGFLVQDCTTNPYTHPLACKTTYREIAQWKNYITPKRQLQFNFVSPTAFRSYGLDLPLPIPELVFNNYFEKWNTYCPENMEISQEWTEFIRHYIKISRITELHTMGWTIPGENKHEKNTGFTGKVTFSLSRKQKLGQDQSFWRDTLTVLQALSDFAVFCGTGQHTTVGMGQTLVMDSR